MTRQTTAHILMVRPANFGFNEQTAESNAFQTNDTSKTIEQIKAEAVAEFDAFVATLRSNGVDVIVADDSPNPVKTDAIFPNNWITFHQDGTIITYPMYAPVRRLERDPNIIQLIDNQFYIKNKIQLEKSESDNIFLEGTGSLILDRPNKLAYACLSPRTNLDMLKTFCDAVGYEPVAFLSVDGDNKEIYHTNVMMALGETFCVICLDTIPNLEERNLVTQHLKDSNKEIVEISLAQMMNFAGNMLQIRNESGELFLVMSQTAYNSLDEGQKANLTKHCKLLPIPIPTIETYGGGSVRCMMAEVFLEKK